MDAQVSLSTGERITVAVIFVVSAAVAVGVIAGAITIIKSVWTLVTG